MDIKNIRRQNLNRLIGRYIFKGFSKAQFAEEIGIPPSQLSQLSGENAVRNIGDKMARRIETSLTLPFGWMDSIQEDQQPPAMEDKYVLTAPTHENTVQKYRVDILDMEFSCGGGRVNCDYPEVIRSIELDPEEAKRMFGGRLATSLKISTAVGDSMLGTISPGDLVVLDITIKKVIGDGIYAFVYGDNFHIKRLQLLKDQLVVISDNPSYERWAITEIEQEDFHIQGLVVGRWQMNYTRLG